MREQNLRARGAGRTVLVCDGRRSVRWQHLAIYIAVISSLLLVGAAPDRKVEEAVVGHAKKDGLSLTVWLDKRVFRPSEPVDVHFELRNETDKEMFIGDGFLAPDYHEAGPGRHFEVHVTGDGDQALRFWTAMLTEGGTLGIRKVFKLGPGEAYAGHIRLAGEAQKEAAGRVQQETLGGSFEDQLTRQKHVLGIHAQKYRLVLRYQVNSRSHRVWTPPKDYGQDALWFGELPSLPLEFHFGSVPR